MTDRERTVAKLVARDPATRGRITARDLAYDAYDLGHRAGAAEAAERWAQAVWTKGMKWPAASHERAILCGVAAAIRAEFPPADPAKEGA